MLNLAPVQALAAQYGRTAVTGAARALLDEARQILTAGDALPPDAFTDGGLGRRLAARLEAAMQPSLRPVFNLTGTVLHTNLGRALMPKSAVEAVTAVMAQPCNLEFDLGRGSRGERDQHVEGLLCELTGAEAALVINNNAAAVFLALNTLAQRKEAIVSRGELIEIGGSFRIPDIMSRAGCRLREVGTTNRTHRADFEQAIGPRTALLLKVHTSNYAIQGFTAAVAEKDLAAVAKAHGLPFIVDLGSGTLIDLKAYGLPHEPTPREALAAGADLVTFSGDKLLGGPQAGMIVGRRELIARIRKNPLKRALRVDKMTLAALEAVLRLYRTPELLARELPTLRFLARPFAQIEEQAERLLPALQRALEGRAEAALKPCMSQIGSGSLPADLLPSMAFALTPSVSGRGQGTALKQMAAALRALPMPIIGRIEDDSLLLDLRCLDDEAGFLRQLQFIKHA